MAKLIWIVVSTMGVDDDHIGWEGTVGLIGSTCNSLESTINLTKVEVDVYKMIVGSHD